MEHWLFTTAVRSAKKLFDGITIITPMMRAEICTKFQISPESVGIWTSGASLSKFDPHEFEKNAVREELGLNEKFVVFYHGSLGLSLAAGHRRGIPETIKSLSILKSQCPDLVLFILGNRESFPWIEKICQEYGVTDRVILHDKVDHDAVPEYIALCNVAIVPLQDIWIWRNQSPLKLLEYLSMEKVVIATDIPANRYVIGESKCGVYISSADPSEITKGIFYAYENREKLQKWGKSGRELVMEKYSWEKVAAGLNEYLTQLGA